MLVLRIVIARDLTSARIDRNVMGSSCLKWDLRGLFECSVDVFLSAFVFSYSESSIRSWCTSSLCQSKVVGIIWLEWRQKLVVQYVHVRISKCCSFHTVCKRDADPHADTVPFL